MSNESVRTNARSVSASPKKADSRADAKPGAKKSAAKKSTKKSAAAGKSTIRKPAAATKKTSKKSSVATTDATTSTNRTDTARTEPMTEATVAAANDSTVPQSASAPRGGHYMNKEQLAYFSEQLAAWKQQLMEEVDRTVGHMKDDATNFPDPNDRATQEEEFSLELRTRDRERKLIKKINEAQKRIDDDEYGYCESCGIEIGVARLEARLTAELCIDCKTLEEIRERQTA